METYTTETLTIFSLAQDRVATGIFGNLKSAQAILAESQFVWLSQSAERVDFLVKRVTGEQVLSLTLLDSRLHAFCNHNEIKTDDPLVEAALLFLDQEQTSPDFQFFQHLRYSREGMIRRVVSERRKKSQLLNYQIRFADNIYGEHILTNEKGKKYRITLRDFENETGYVNSADWRFNKLGTTKHIMFAFRKIKENQEQFAKMDKTYPFIEIYLDPLNDYRISWFYPEKMTSDEEELIKAYFGDKNYLEPGAEIEFARFLDRARLHTHIKIRPEVIQKVEQAYDQSTLNTLKESQQVDFSLVSTPLFDYQKEGVEFITFRSAAMLADEMGLGKTIQAIAAAANKKQLLGFEKCLVVCPASLKSQWQEEIRKFSDLSATIIQGDFEQRKLQYQHSKDFFILANYEQVSKDVAVINKMGVDLLILDEAQRIKNFQTKTAEAIKQVKKTHALILTGTPVENKLVDLYSLMQVLDPAFLGPLWEFSYRYCLFDTSKSDKINAYYNLQSLKERLEPILLRREKHKVLEQLPNVNQVFVPVPLHPEQEVKHREFASAVSRILHKKVMSPFDLQRVSLLLNQMRMVSNSTFLIDGETHFSPKLDELHHLLTEKFDIKNSSRKIIIFSEWLKMHDEISDMLDDLGVSYVKLNGKIPVPKRAGLITEFEENPKCQVFLSTEAGGTGLNLQAADTVVNFELPWNPAKKNQRIGRIDRVGQMSHNLTVVNLYSTNSIEVKIAHGLELKQNLFDSVLNEGNLTDLVDFSQKGRGQFLNEIREMLVTLENEEPEETEELEVEEKKVSIPVHKQEKLQEVLQSGMQFIAGLVEMSTGEQMDLSEEMISIDENSGEVTLKFKLPGNRR